MHGNFIGIKNMNNIKINIISLNIATTKKNLI